MRKGCVNRIFRQIGRDAEPQHERALVGVEAGRLERCGHAAAIKVMRHIDEVSRRRDARLGQTLALVSLSSRVIELEDSQLFRGLEPIGEGVEPRAEDDDLQHPSPNRAARRILCKSAAHRNEQA